MPLKVIFPLFSALMVCVSSCTPPPRPKMTIEEKSDFLVGKIAAVYNKDNYLLVKKYKSFHIPLDRIFYSRGDDGSVNSLKMTGQKLGQFYVADLNKGSYSVNDPVFMRDLHKTMQEKENPSSEEAPNNLNNSQ